MFKPFVFLKTTVTRREKEGKEQEKEKKKKCKYLEKKITKQYLTVGIPGDKRPRYKEGIYEQVFCKRKT